MNINDLTVGQAKKLAEMFGTLSAEAPESPHIGKKCIIRCEASGVHFGTLLSMRGRQVELECARRLWKWDVTEHGISLSEAAVFGPDGPETKICATVPSITLLDAIEVIPCTGRAVSVIVDAKIFKA